MLANFLIVKDGNKKKPLQQEPGKQAKNMPI